MIALHSVRNLDKRRQFERQIKGKGWTTGNALERILESPSFFLFLGSFRKEAREWPTSRYHTPLFLSEIKALLTSIFLSIQKYCKGSLVLHELWPLHD